MSRDGHQDRRRKPRLPLDPASLEALAIHYVGRYATTRARLRDYLARKVKERGWADEARFDPAALADRLAALGYIDDRAFATARSSSLTRRGYGLRRVDVALDVAGVAEEDRQEAEALAEGGALTAALTLARRRRVGPFAAQAMDRAGRDKAIAMLLRAGHDFAIARRIVFAAPGEVIDDESD